MTVDIYYDLRFALPMRPGFTLLAVLTPGLGIGANAAIFSLTDAPSPAEIIGVSPTGLVLVSLKGPRTENLCDGEGI